MLLPTLCILSWHIRLAEHHNTNVRLASSFPINPFAINPFAITSSMAAETSQSSQNQKGTALAVPCSDRSINDVKTLLRK
jgi:hypothetical protein